MRPNPFQALPDTVEVCGRSVQINSDFRAGIAIELEVTAENPDILGLLDMFYLGNAPEQVKEAVDRMIEFYAHSDGGEKGEGGGKSKRSYDFEQDADALLSSFLDTYGIDLSTAMLHWWTFKRLLCNLPPETPFMQRIYFRTADVKKLSKAEREHVLKMRRVYALKTTSTGPQKSAEELDREFLEKTRRRFEEAQMAVKKG